MDREKKKLQRSTREFGDVIESNKSGVRQGWGASSYSHWPHSSLYSPFLCWNPFFLVLPRPLLICQGKKKMLSDFWRGESRQLVMQLKKRVQKPPQEARCCTSKQRAVVFIKLVSTLKSLSSVLPTSNRKYFWWCKKIALGFLTDWLPFSCNETRKPLLLASL